MSGSTTCAEHARDRRPLDARPRALALTSYPASWRHRIAARPLRSWTSMTRIRGVVMSIPCAPPGAGQRSKCPAQRQLTPAQNAERHCGGGVPGPGDEARDRPERVRGGGADEMQAGNRGLESAPEHRRPVDRVDRVRQGLAQEWVGADIDLVPGSEHQMIDVALGAVTELEPQMLILRLGSGDAAPRLHRDRLEPIAQPVAAGRTGTAAQAIPDARRERPEKIGGGGEPARARPADAGGSVPPIRPLALL